MMRGYIGLVLLLLIMLFGLVNVLDRPEELPLLVTEPDAGSGVYPTHSAVTAPTWFAPCPLGPQNRPAVVERKT